MTIQTKSILTEKLTAQLRAAFPNDDEDPLLLAKTTTDEAIVYYLIEIHTDDRDRDWITFFSPYDCPTFRGVLSSTLASSFDEDFLCPDFQPTRLSKINPS